MGLWSWRDSIKAAGTAGQSTASSFPGVRAPPCSAWASARPSCWLSIRSWSEAIALMSTAAPQLGPQWISRLTFLEDPSANRRVNLTFPACSRIDHPWPCSSLICSRRRQTQGSVRPGLTRGMAPTESHLPTQAGGMFVLDPSCPKWPQEWAHFPGHRAMDASPSAMLRYREHQRLTERTQSKLRVDSTPREVFAHWVSTRAFHTRSRSRSPA